MVEVINTTSTSITANQVIPFTTNTLDTNNRISFNPTTNAIVISKVGKYEINGSFVFSSTTAQNCTFTAYANGVAINADLASFSVVADDVYTFTLPSKVINIVPSTYGNVVNITFSANANGTLTNAVASVKYVK